MERRRSSDAPIEDSLTSTGYYSRRPRAITSFASPYTPQESHEAEATFGLPVGLPGRASLDLSAYLNTDAASLESIGDAQYRRYSGVKDETGVTQFKQE